MRDKYRNAEDPAIFTSAILPPYLRKSRSNEEWIPWLDLNGFSLGDYPEALRAVLGQAANGFQTQRHGPVRRPKAGGN